MTVPLPPSAEFERLRSALDITHSLISAISSTDPLPALASRLSVLCQGSATIYSSEGAIVASSGEAPTHLIWQEVTNTNLNDLEFEVGRWHVLTRRVSLQDSVHVIAISSRGPETLARIGELLLDSSERLLGAVHGIRYGASQRDRRDNEQLLAALHDGMVPAREHRFWGRISQFRFPAYAPVRSVELDPFDTSSATEDHISELVGRARTENLPLLAMLRRATIDAPATVSALISDSPAGEQWLKQAAESFLVGVSEPTTALSQIPQSVREAETALDIARSWSASSDPLVRPAPAFIDRIDLSTWLLSQADRHQLKARIERTLSPIDSHQIRETLLAYFASDQSISRTAEALFVHPNTVRYRLARVEDSIGEPLASASATANLILALYPALIGNVVTKPDGEAPT
ncbi:PucR family transcriptional regulator [Gulosibacter molinativorax]|uniref:PucR family transcriptional regulator n=1 Tax=Gulosibacter molinativorax TaxID=256821 RepID=A0ABT7CA61_9MICO|nr:helix-turn-helix domain-containing protein [Gulosibacter molinativorax]MDJ1372078.1 PucR family transcriptional regulator [Gulosibacter molinativorax]QUY63873.1 Hypotetical protein [Gulosibacter molinativorax]